MSMQNVSHEDGKKAKSRWQHLLVICATDVAGRGGLVTTTPGLFLDLTIAQVTATTTAITVTAPIVTATPIQTAVAVDVICTSTLLKAQSSTYMGDRILKRSSIQLMINMVFFN